MADSSPKMFKGFQGGQPGSTRQMRDHKFTPGRYIARIESVTLEQPRRNPEFLLIRMTNLACTEAPAQDGDIPKKWLAGGTTKVGEEVTYKIWDNDSFGGKVVTMLCNLTGCDESDVDEGMLVRLVSEEQPLAGYIVDLTVEHRWRQKELNDDGSVKENHEGGYLSAHFWRAFDGDDQEELLQAVGEEVFNKYVTAE